MPNCTTVIRQKQESAERKKMGGGENDRGFAIRTFQQILLKEITKL
jgi:hypothetical protein